MIGNKPVINDSMLRDLFNNQGGSFQYDISTVKRTYSFIYKKLKIRVKLDVNSVPSDIYDVIVKVNCPLLSFLLENT